MATNKKDQVSIIKEESINNALETFKLSYKENEEEYAKGNLKIEDVVNLTKGFSGKSTILASTVILSVMIAMPPMEFMALMETAKSVSKVKFLEAIKESLFKKEVKDADNDIDK